MSGLKKVHTYMPADSIFHGPVTNILSVLCILIELFSRARAKGGKKLNDFKFGSFIGRFPSDGAACKNGSERVNGMQIKFIVMVYDPVYLCRA